MAEKLTEKLKKSIISTTGGNIHINITTHKSKRLKMANYKLGLPYLNQ